MKLSAIILSKNEEESIEDCIKSVNFCDEIIVVDDYSIDKTLKIAEGLGAKVYKRKLNCDFATQRNFGLDKASGDWALFVDADERIPQALASEISNLKSQISNLNQGYLIKREDYLWGRRLKYGETGNTKLLRLAKKNAGKWKRKVHEYWDISGSIGELKNPILHNPHQTLREFIDEINFYSTLHAQANLEEGKRSSILKIIFLAKLKFINNFILKFGFLDGTRGFVHAMLMSFHSYLAWSKLWLLQKK